MPTYEQLGFGQGAALTGDRERAVFGQVMGLVAFALGFAALGAYIARDAQTGGFIFFIGAIVCIFGLQAAAARGHEQLAIALLFGLAHRERVRELAKFLGLDAESIAEGLVDAVDRDPALRQSTYLHRAA